MKNYQKNRVNEYQQPIGELVDTIHFQMIDEKVLNGQSQLRLIPFQRLDDVGNRIAQLFQVIEREPDERCWTYLPYEKPIDVEQLIERLSQNFGFENCIHYLIEVDGRLLGYIALMNARMTVGVIEIGNVYFSHELRRQKVSTEVIYLLLNTSFQSGFRRVEWKCDDLNQPSKNAALRFGFSYEGLFRQDRIYKGRNRNTAWFSMLDDEWLLIQKGYEAWLDEQNFDTNGLQKNKINDLIQKYLDSNMA
ncbi:Protein N-acetyltransferase, RimJ/RimL family [Acinetobacter marinus]|uniref:Protein N-acetyltransferase, RimJ/RimL family n=1 Tax=Acinetobacter marinus TaxID=281375 RepID=A0A1G6N9L9_9GAMM|nr:GNAT family protein [Acinetobacter marinus]SDC64538.1 Protein N-acetyltransferase, RimJ/RimL family [Acinetobacter marinus]